MADEPNIREATPTTPERAPGMPRWVRVSLIALATLAALFVVGKVTGAGGKHGPGRHSGGDSPATVVADEEGRHRSPVDHGR